MGLPCVRKAAVLYLALEDDYRRLQERLYRMFGTDGADNLFFSVSAGNLGHGLDEQLQEFMKKHTDTRLIIIDTLQKVREVGGDNYSYANDYEIITRLKQFADSYGICILLVHHTRKQGSDDKFDMISGTTGLLGAADGVFLLQKEKRTGNAVTLEISGRDQQDQKLYLIRNTETLVWELERADTELWKEPPEPLLERIAEVFSSGGNRWEGTPTELCECLGMDLKPNVMTLKLNVNAGSLLREYNIYYDRKRCHGGRKVLLWKDEEERV
jgi:RecA-family ATPase